MTFLLVITLVFALFGWLKNKLGLLVFVHYMDTKGCDPPSDAEIRECTKWVVRHALNMK